MHRTDPSPIPSRALRKVLIILAAGAALALLTPGPAVRAQDGDKRRHAEARALLARGEQHQKDGQVTEAQQTWRQAKALLRKLADDFPAVPGYRQDWARCQMHLAQLGLDTGRYKEARPALRQAVALLEKLVLDFPDTPAYRLDLVRGYTQHGELLQRTGKTREADKMFRRASELKQSVELKSK